jgi:predicted nucleotidyltransferase
MRELKEPLGPFSLDCLPGYRSSVLSCMARARGDYRPDSDADLALILVQRGDDWQLLWDLSGLAYDVFLETGVLIQPVPISSSDWAHPERFPRPSFLRNVAREGISL